MIYLASPYSDDNPTVESERFLAACTATAKLMQRGEMVFSPIAHSHPVAKLGRLAGDFAFWGKWNREMLNRCDSLAVLMLPGWEESLGVCGEVNYAQQLGKDIAYLDPETLEEVERGEVA